MMNNITEIKQDNSQETVTCNRCGFSGKTDDFEPCLSAQHDLKCPDCGSTDIDWNYGSYVNNNLVMNLCEYDHHNHG